MTRTHRIASLIAGAIAGFALYQYFAADDVVDLGARDRRTREAAPIRSHRAPPTTPSLDVVERDGDRPTITFAPRDASEWQGMLVNTAFQASCDTSARCGLAMACHTGRCGACRMDSECAVGEVCSMQHCVAAAQTACRSRADCPIGELCMLTGYSDDARGNGDLHAYCSGSPPALARTVESDEAAHAAELARAEPAPLQVDNPAMPEGLVQLLQD